MRLRNTQLTKFAGLAIARLALHWLSTLECRMFYYDRGVDPSMAEYQGPAIYVFWHEYILLPFYLRGHCNIAMLTSQHQDGELLSEAARHLGYATIRGSSTRGGVTALREAMRTLDNCSLAITPDGPRGPRRRLASGCVYLASRLQIPVVAAGIGYDRPWRIRRAWDRFAVPRPFSRARVIVGPRLQLPPGLTRDACETYRQQLEQFLEALTQHAEHWAATGARLEGDLAGRPQPRHLGPD